MRLRGTGHLLLGSGDAGADEAGDVRPAFGGHPGGPAPHGSPYSRFSFWFLYVCASFVGERVLFGLRRIHVRLFGREIPAQNDALRLSRQPDRYVQVLTATTAAPPPDSSER